MTVRSSRDPITDRIACWKQAYDAVLNEVEVSWVGAGVVIEENGPWQPPQWLIELAARTAATLAIGATTRERGE